MVNRRAFLSGCGAALALAPAARAGAEAFRFGVTPVFLDNDASLLESLGAALSEISGFPVSFVQRRTYEEVTGILLQGAVDAAWLCGYPYLQHADALDLVAVPLWRGKPLYQSYLIAGAEDPAQGLADLQGGVHAFSDPNSNSGYLVTVTDLLRMGETPERFFSRSFFTYGHRNVVRAVASGLARSGSVDGYVWEALATVEPELTAATKIIGRSEWLGFPPICASGERRDEARLAAFARALFELGTTEAGRQTLGLMQLDGFAAEPASIYDGIARRMRELDEAQ